MQDVPLEQMLHDEKWGRGVCVPASGSSSINQQLNRTKAFYFLTRVRHLGPEL